MLGGSLIYQRTAGPKNPKSKNGLHFDAFVDWILLSELDEFWALMVDSSRGKDTIIHESWSSASMLHGWSCGCGFFGRWMGLWILKTGFWSWKSRMLRKDLI